MTTMTDQLMTPDQAREIARAADAACEAIGRLVDAVGRLSEAIAACRASVRLESGADGMPVWHWEPDPGDLNPVRKPGNL
jgi:hypothetical protein